MKSGKLRHFVKVEQFTQTGTGTRGEKQGSWGSLYEDVPASIETLGGREAEVARQIVSTADTKVGLRWLAGITTKMRINHNDKLYNIEAINNIDQRDRELILTCSGVA
jgi:SPP1 family predicted phage head-tail adaptor